MMQPAAPAKAIILVVEDEPLLRMLAVDFIEDAGFDVVEAASADIAVAILESRTDIRIVFTDIDMPGSMDGLKLAAAVRDRWPPVKIIVASGHRQLSDELLPVEGKFFSKPYDHNSVIMAMREMLAAA